MRCGVSICLLIHDDQSYREFAQQRSVVEGKSSWSFWLRVLVVRMPRHGESVGWGGREACRSTGAGCAARQVCCRRPTKNPS